MSNRSYDGEPLDLSWNDPPWKNEGETVEASDDNREAGKMTTTDWPEAATPEEELTDKQQRIIRTAAKYPHLKSPKKLFVQSNLDEYVSHGYPSQVLSQHWREWLQQENQSPSRQRKWAKLSREDVKEMRVKILNEQTSGELAEEYGVSPRAVRKAVKGETYADVENPPTVKFDQSENVWVQNKDDSAEQSELTDSELSEELASATNTTTDRIEARSEQIEMSPPPEQPRQNNTDYTKVLAAGIIGYQLLKYLWSLIRSN